MRIGRAPKWPRSAYIASPPVTARKAAPSIAKLTCQPAWSMKSTARNGLAAARISGLATIPAIPRSPRTTNQTSMTGPNTRPMAATPLCWTRNRPTRITSVIGTTYGPSDGASTFRPSIAESTEIAGVIAPSP